MQSTQFYNYNANNNNYFNYNQNYNYAHSGNYNSQTKIRRINKKWNRELLDFFHTTKISSFMILVFAGIALFIFVLSARALLFSESDVQVTNQPGFSFDDDGTNEYRSEPLDQVPPTDSKIPINDDPPKKSSIDIQAEKKAAEREEKNQALMIANKRESIKQAFVHAFEGYSKYAFGYDEIRPLTNETNSSWGGFGVTLFDCLDTMLIMKLDKMYEKARDYALSVDFEKDHDASFFEFSIRYVGGLLGAFELSKDERLLHKAKEMADRLLWAFNSTTGIPYSIVNLKTHNARNPSWSGGASVLAEAGSVQLEFKYLSHHLKDPIYAQKAQKVMDVFFEQDKFEGLYPVYINPQTGEFHNDLVSFGALGDSFYEYLLKQYLLTGMKEEQFLEMYHESIEGMINRMLVRVPSKLAFIGEYRIKSKQIINEMDHLVCYVPGMLALGAFGEHERSHLKLAEELVRSCYYTYEQQPTGLGPERFQFFPDSGKDFRIVSSRYLLRPETVESIFVLYRKTRNPIYRDWGWKIFKAIEKYCKTPSSYSGLLDVSDPKTAQNNSMQSFFLAETLKYLYLLFSEEDLIRLDKYVFTTEAHPLGIFEAT